MVLERQVCSLNLAKELKELKVYQDSLFCYCLDPTEREYIHLSSPCHHDHCAAFTAGELGELLPDGFVAFREGHYWKLKVQPGLKVIKVNGKLYLPSMTEADARARGLIYLLENKLAKRNTGLSSEYVMK